MRKLIVFVSIFLLSTFVSEEVKAQCPFGGQINCEGECGRFTDDNGDGFCDFGTVETAKPTPQSTEQVEQNANDSIKTQQNLPATKETTTQVKKTDSQSKQSSANTEQKEVELQQEASQSMTSQPIALQTETATEEEVEKKKNIPRPYNALLITGICLAAYLLTFVLVKLGKIKKITHRKIWNVVLLFTCLVSCLLGLVLALQINYRFGMDYFRDLLKLHVEFGIAMTVVVIFHIIWHLKYYKNLFKKS